MFRREDSKHRTTVFAIFRAEVRIVDPVKKAVMSRMLLESVKSIDHGELLVDKLKATPLPKALGGDREFKHHSRILVGPEIAV